MKKQGVFLYTAIAIAACLLMSFTQDYLQKRVIRSKGYDEHFYIYTKDRTTERDKIYHWFKSGAVHQSYGAAGGPVLHKEYLKYYADQQLAVQGSYNYGLKVGTWKHWYPNGNYAQVIQWKNGSKNGDYTKYDRLGTPVLKGRYVRDIKAGVWVDLIAKDTLWYKKGVAYNEPPRDIQRREDSIAGKRSLWKRIFGKRQLDSTQVDSVRPSLFKRWFGKKQQDSTAVDTVRRPGLFKRWFGKKDPDNKSEIPDD